MAVALERGEDEAEYRQQTHAGIQPVRVSRDGDRAYASILQEPAQFGEEVDPAAILAAIGLGPRTRIRRCRRSTSAPASPPSSRRWRAPTP